MRHLTDEYGSITARMSYDPYGAPIPPTTTSSLGFTGELTDPLGLVYLRARTYNPSLGIFTQRDPVLGIAGLSASYNGYGYVHGNPVNLTDPSGEIAWFFVLAGVLKILAGGIAGATIVGGAAFANDVRGQVWYNQTQLGMSFGDAFQHLDRGGLINSAVGGAEFGFNLGLGFGAGALANGLRFAGMKALAAGAMSDFGLGVTYDMAAHGDNLGTALLANALGFMGGELAGDVLNAGLRRIGQASQNMGRNFGVWAYAIDGRIDTASRMLAQESDNSCVIACMREMLRREGIETTEEEIIARFRPDTYSSELGVTDPREMRRVMQEFHPQGNYSISLPGHNWDEVLANLQELPEASMLWLRKGKDGHAFIVEGVVGRVMHITDPDPGPGVEIAIGRLATTYTARWEDIQPFFRNAFGTGLFPER